TRLPRTAGQLVGQPLPFGTNHKAQGVGAFLASALSLARVALVLGQVRLPQSLPVCLGGGLSR
ncbi:MULTISPECIES: hypothetical protein, partial [unclassified Pseudomonas]|uniref:hypothetical protein n=1 Tax=unclassified Pseudomonas TaxID=196821 RepID=UPI001C458C79